MASAATVAGARMPAGLSPNIAVPARASNGVSGGWSAYPQSSRVPAARKYSSSR